MSANTTSLHDALAEFSDSHLTVRLVQALLGAVPTAAPLPSYSRLDEALASLHPDAPAGVLAEAERLATAPEIATALWACRSVDTGDTGITVVSGLNTALGLFFGKTILSEDTPQRTDAALKALAIAYLVGKVLPGPVVQSLDILEQLPSGRALLTVFGAVEIALPFSDEVKAAEGTFVAELVDRYAERVVGKLASVTGEEEAKGARANLVALIGRLDEAATETAKHVDPLAETAANYLPTAFGGRDRVPDLVATGADALPIYSLFGARIAAEACLWRARAAIDPAFPPKPEPAPGPEADPFADPPPAGRTISPSTPHPTPPEPQTHDPFATPKPTPRTMAPLPPANPFGTPETARPRTGAPDATPPPHSQPSLADEPLPPGLRRARQAPRTLTRMESPTQSFTIGAPPPPPPDEEEAEERATPPEPAPTPPEPVWDPGDPLSGVFVHREGGREIWLAFSSGGHFTAQPPTKAPPHDWGAYEAAGHPVGRYHRDGEALTIHWPDGNKQKASIEVKDFAVVLDGRTCRRADFNLANRTFSGTWDLRGIATGGYTFYDDGTFSLPHDPVRGGTYRLGVAQITLHWKDGTTETLGLLSDLRPRRASPDLLLIAGRPYDRLGS